MMYPATVTNSGLFHLHFQNKKVMSSRLIILVVLVVILGSFLPSIMVVMIGKGKLSPGQNMLWLFENPANLFRELSPSHDEYTNQNLSYIGKQNIATMFKSVESDIPKLVTNTNPSEDNDYSNVTNWKRWYNSPQCLEHRSTPPGKSSLKTMGIGMRSLCSNDPNEKLAEEYKAEIPGSIDISITHRAIYIPVMKAATQSFQALFRKKFHGRRIPDRMLRMYLQQHGLKLSDFFVFTFVRDPFKIFVSSYREISKYAMNNRTAHTGFTLIPNTAENEPLRALTCLDNVRSGVFHGLVPAHMHTQLWKIQRCFKSKSQVKKNIEFNFIGHLENIDEDWKYVEKMLNIPSTPLPFVHSASDKSWNGHSLKQDISRLQFDPVSSATSKFSDLTKRVCEYYRSDFVCFGYDDSPCRT